MGKVDYFDNKRFPGYWFKYKFGERAAMVVQIGSNDGKTGDPLYQLLQENEEWQALFVEPIPHFYERLRKNYGELNRFQFANVAIGKESGAKTFYWVDPKAEQELEDLPYWYEQLGSFDRTHIEKELDGKLEPYIVSASLPCLTLKELFEKYGVRDLDILHIDAEGFDWQILQQLDLNSYHPHFILFEYHHLSLQDQKAAAQFLNDLYILFSAGIDLFAVSRKSNELHEIAKEMPHFSLDKNLVQR